MIISTNTVIKEQAGYPIEVSTPEGMVAVMTSANLGKVYKYTGETTADYVSGGLYQVVEE